jgi:glycosyltransferase involved in cell wall biosynthesis
MDAQHHDLFNKIEERVALRLARFADLAIANSHAGHDYVVEHGFSPGKTIVIPNGIDTDRFQPDLNGRAAIRAELGIAEDEVLIGRVGRLAPQKDYPTFLRAASLIARQLPKSRFVCVGAGSDAFTAELKALAQELELGERVQWLGARDEMPAIYSALDLNVSSSVFGEGTPNAVAEAMACGVPCVVTDIGDSAITVGNLGRVVPAEDPDALAEASIAMLSAPVDQHALRAHVVRSLSLTNLIDRSESALLSLLPGESRAPRAVREGGL